MRAVLTAFLLVFKRLSYSFDRVKNINALLKYYYELIKSSYCTILYSVQCTVVYRLETNRFDEIFIIKFKS